MVHVRNGGAHALEDDVGAADVEAPYSLGKVKFFRKGDLDLGSGPGYDGAFDGLLCQGVNPRNKNLGTVPARERRKKDIGGQCADKGSRCLLETVFGEGKTRAQEKRGNRAPELAGLKPKGGEAR